MKPCRTLLLCSCLWAFPAIAQDDDEKSNGIRLGYHMSDLAAEDDVDIRSGFYGGIYRNWLKLPLISVSTGLEFNTAGATSELTELRLSYLALPVNGRLKLGPLYFDLGVDVGFKISEKWLQDGDEIDIPDDFKGETVDFLGHIGAGVKFLGLGFDLRYRHGLVDVYEDTRNTGLEAGLSTFF